MTEKNISNNVETAVMIPKAELAAIVRDRSELATMLGSLIVMWKHEEKLKQHHRPYLHVRKETEKLCNTYLKHLSEVTERMGNGLHICSADCRAAEQTKEPEASVNRGEIIKMVDALVGDLVTLMEYMDVQRNFIRLLESGIEMEEVTAKFDRFLLTELNEMMERWDKYMTEHSHESE